MRAAAAAASAAASAILLYTFTSILYFYFSLVVFFLLRKEAENCRLDRLSLPNVAPFEILILFKLVLCEYIAASQNIFPTVRQFGLVKPGIRVVKSFPPSIVCFVALY